PLGVKKVGLRLFGDPIQAVESDLTATVLVLANDECKLALVATDLCTMTMREADEIRAELGAALGTPATHVLFNMSHNHSSPGLPEYMAMTDTPEDAELRRRYERSLRVALVEAALDADAELRPARIGTGWGASGAAVYRRELVAGTYVLGEVPDHPVDDS